MERRILIVLWWSMMGFFGGAVGESVPFGAAIATTVGGIGEDAIFTDLQPLSVAAGNKLTTHILTTPGETAETGKRKGEGRETTLGKAWDTSTAQGNGSAERSATLKRKLLDIPVTKDLISLEGEATYLDNEQMENFLRGFVKRCGNISRLLSIGNSVLGKPLWVLEISDNPGQMEPEPSFKYVGNMHGDEPLGRQLLLYLADWLCDGYRQNDPLATTVVRDVHLYLLLTMNPDGFGLHQRENANGVDLNRDFPDQYMRKNDDEKGRQPETRAVMEWILKTRFVASASLHEGAVVANYPWDGSDDQSTKYAACPDDAAFRVLAKAYADFHPFMATTKNTEFVTGITNGAAWYPLYGGMQDWNYIHGHCMELTVEMCERKWPAHDQLPQLWKDHRSSLLSLVTTVLKAGVYGFISAVDTGKPLPAEVTVASIPIFKVFAGKAFGDFYRIVAPGSYKFVVTMEGYRNVSAMVNVPAGRRVNLNITMEPHGWSRSDVGLRKSRKDLVDGDISKVVGNSGIAVDDVTKKSKMVSDPLSRDGGVQVGIVQQKTGGDEGAAVEEEEDNPRHEQEEARKKVKVDDAKIGREHGEQKQRRRNKSSTMMYDKNSLGRLAMENWLVVMLCFACLVMLSRQRCGRKRYIPV